LIVSACVAGCGDEGLHFDLKTPPQLPGDVPIPPKGQRLVNVKPTMADAEKLKPTILKWTETIRRAQPFSAAGFFNLPTVVSAPGAPNLQLNTVNVAAAYAASLACAPEKLVKLAPAGRFLVGEFVQGAYPGRPCAGKGTIERIGFVFGNPDHPKQFTELWTAPPASKEETGPATRPTDAIPVQAQQLEQLVGLG
jgi:hypothetical protein